MPLPNVRELCERLCDHTVIRKGESVIVDMHDGRGPVEVPTGDTVMVRNPDGLEAAAVLEQQAERIARLEAALIQISLGGDDPAGIAMDVLKWGDLASGVNGEKCEVLGLRRERETCRDPSQA